MISKLMEADAPNLLGAYHWTWNDATLVDVKMTLLRAQYP